VLVVGPSKTGTTGLYNSIRDGYGRAGHALRTVFEPKDAALLDNLFRLTYGVPVLVKATQQSLDTVTLEPEAFERRVMTVRDPRDIVVSALLFRPLIAKVLARLDDAALETFVAALERKEADPASVSVTELFELQAQLGIGGPPASIMKGVLPRQRELIARHGFLVVKYEQFVRDELAELSDYLGVEVRNVSAEDSTLFGHIARSRSSGDFLRWFRADDLAYFNGLFGEHIEALGYQLDVPLDSDPKIDPQTSSEYVRSRFAQRRDRLRTQRAAEWTPARVDSPQRLAELHDAAVNGDPLACRRAAEVALAGHLGSRDDEAALRWARAGAELGSPWGMRRAAELLRATRPDDPAAIREARAWELAHRARSGPGRSAVRRTANLEKRAVALEKRAAAAERQAAALERELAALRASRRYRLGIALVRGARHPVREARRSLRRRRAQSVR
jgi:hypothetical protein